jgi:hypothetical protein
MCIYTAHDDNAIEQAYQRQHAIRRAQALRTTNPLAACYRGSLRYATERCRIATTRTVSSAAGSW